MLRLRSYCAGRGQTAIAFLCAVIGGAFALMTLLGAAEADKAHNPHWNKEGCVTCHQVQDGKMLPLAPAAADEACLKCHDGRKAPAEFHPVGREFDNQKYTRPEKWPLVEGRLGCITCHDVKGACSEVVQRPGSNTANRMMLRDFQAGRSQSQPFCRNCHQADAYQKINPHLMLLADKDEIVEEKCLFCHSQPLDRKTLARQDKPALKLDESQLCRDCHPQHKDAMIQGHAGLKVTDDMRALMYIREVTGLQSAVREDMIAQIKKTGRKPTKMPVTANGTVQCSTCHNPHQYGVFPKESALSYRAMRLVDKKKMISPVRGQAWCKHCHEF